MQKQVDLSVTLAILTVFHQTEHLHVPSNLGRNIIKYIKFVSLTQLPGGLKFPSTGLEILLHSKQDRLYIHISF